MITTILWIALVLGAVISSITVMVYNGKLEEVRGELNTSEERNDWLERKVSRLERNIYLMEKAEHDRTVRAHAKPQVSSARSESKKQNSGRTVSGSSPSSQSRKSSNSNRRDDSNDLLSPSNLFSPIYTTQHFSDNDSHKPSKSYDSDSSSSSSSSSYDSSSSSSSYDSGSSGGGGFD